VVRQADSLTCTTSGDCTWTAPPPGTGVWQATARATDFAGNVSPASAKFLLTISFG